MLPSIITESVDAESLSNETENSDILFNLLNHKKNPTLDITTVEIPIEKQDLFDRIFQRGEEKETTTLASISTSTSHFDDFPDFDFTHIRHRLPEPSFRPLAVTSTTQGPFIVRDLDLFGAPDLNRLLETSGGNPLDMDPVISFSPTNKKLVMTSQDFKDRMNEIHAQTHHKNHRPIDNDADVDKKGSFLDLLLQKSFQE